MKARRNKCNSVLLDKLALIIEFASCLEHARVSYCFYFCCIFNEKYDYTLIE